MNIVFTTTCKNRTFHLERTLPQNLMDNPTSKFVVLNYGTQDNLLEVLQPLRSDRLVVYSYDAPDRFRMAHAKNMAHRCAMLEGGEILVNVDADNYTGRGFEDFVAREFDALPGIFLQARMIKGKMSRGVSGRIAVTVPSFLKVGGYDEARFSGWGSDDKDLNLRLRTLGYDHVEIPPSYLKCLPHNDKMRFKEYPERAKFSDDYFAVTPANTTQTVVNDGWVGCGVVYRDSDEIRLDPIPTRIFGIGMHKTATTSLHRALELLGYESVHWPSGVWARDVWQEMTTLGRSPTLERSYAASDLPIPILFRQLDKAYPGSKFILTMRDEVEWLESVRRHWSYQHNQFRWQWDVYPINNKMHKLVYGRTDFDPKVFLERYRQHNAEVVEYFEGRPEDLLVMTEPRWDELCGFLKRPVPVVGYPRQNSGSEPV